jgi:hypothetical protein
MGDVKGSETAAAEQMFTSQTKNIYHISEAPINSMIPRNSIG